MSDWQRKNWAAAQEAQDAAIAKQREREKKARERSARNAQRKIARLRKTLAENGEITDFEDEFAGSVAERLDKYGAAFADPGLGRPGDALSSAQKRVVASMNRKVKEARAAEKAKRAEAAETEEDKAAPAPSANVVRLTPRR
ncbi:hypothetical protein [Parvularcula dongshanensis]|uniref:Uncharacterized protein n=1 Tax=Parvularcula dongshanensis TaxID=1173995 RepID=A0A840I2A4_9PROT|nr:hypothetical protein [Parvularcula dongshanensis]MBB4658364.1 hypothetical protein [Parvularcula dongshanensis]